jgi:hypothetical protein
MGESAIHRSLVMALAGWIAATHLRGDINLVLIDGAISPLAKRPPAVNGYVPDVVVPRAFSGRFIIGEAKTRSDLESKHTVAQLEAFVCGCQRHEGSLFLLAVPWDVTVLARHLVEAIVEKAGLPRVEAKVVDPRVEVQRGGVWNA